MKKFTIISLLAMLLAPAAYADEFPPGFGPDWVERLVEQARANGTVIETRSSASVSTGGQIVTGGQTVTTGPSSASSYVETHINASDSGGEVQVHVETSKNGEVEAKDYSKTLDPGAGVQVETDVSATDEKTESSVRVDGEELSSASSNSSSASAQAAAAAEAGTDGAQPGMSLITAIFDKIRSFFSWF